NEGQVHQVGGGELRRVAAERSQRAAAATYDPNGQEEKWRAENGDEVPLRGSAKLVVVTPQGAGPGLAVGDPRHQESHAGEAEDRDQQDAGLGRDVHWQNSKSGPAKERWNKKDPADRIEDQQEGSHRAPGDHLLD